MQTENTYVETDLGNIALNPRGEYSDETSYEYLDTVSYMGGSYMCLAELTKTISGIAPEEGKNTEHWQMLTLPGGLTSDYIAMHDDVVNDAKQVETSRAAVELSQQEVEAAQADVRQMRQDTQEAAEEAASSRDSAAGYAQSAETSRTAAKESENNINAQVTGFDTHVTEKTSEAESTVEEARKTAIDAITTQQDASTKAVTDEGTTQTNRVEGAGNTAVSAVAKQQAASVQAVENAGTAQVTAIESAGDEQITEINKAGTVQVENVEEAAKQQNVILTEAAAQELIKLQAVAKQFAEDHEQIETNKEDISNKITKFYASNQGETHLADSDNGKIMDMMLYGKSEQKQYSGKNLLELSDNQVQSENLKIQINQGIITFSGTANDDKFIREIDSFIVPSDGTYTISTNSNGNNDSPRILFLINDNPQYGSAFNGATKELNAGDVVRLYIRISSAGSYDGVTIKPMIEKGSKVTSYEPYTGGQPSPSPDYPQEIKSVVNPIVKVYGKNMMPYPKDNTVRRNGVTLTVKDGKYTLVGKPTTNTWLNIYPQVLNSTAEDMLPEKPLPTKGKNISMINGSEGYSLNFRKVSNSSKVFGIEHNNAKLADEDSNGVFLYIYNIDKTYNDTFEIMISDPADTTSTVFEPYTEQEVSLPYTLNAIPVNSGGNVTIDGQQYVADYVDVERGKIVKCVEKYRIPSGLKWIYEPSENDRFGTYGLNININPNFGGNTLFTHYQNKPNGVGGFIAPGNIRLHNFKGFTDVTNFKEWLDKNESYAYFVKNTFEETDLTTEEITAFKELATYYPVTNISVNSEQLDGYAVFNYPISMQNGWNYVKQQLNDNRDYIYDMDTKTQDIDTQAAEAYVNSEYAVALTELEV